ncbi:MAG: o-succinylbenzoate synthase [Deltaproteobacteria bacterium]|nr:o-succinylbenzoate synthase [Deltaproteobacteria bacterium]MBW2400301.1 o-succinylbenzoate synthase [Deltaproteobacteria bacterium]MBW2664674.1 o-succinylbenzoate synthase [Deltaproteobacteria bacterium]
MKIIRARVIPIRLALAEPIATSRGEIRIREGALIELVSESGTRGWGEALPLPGFGLETAEEAVVALEAIGRALVAEEFAGVDTALDCADETAPTAKAARAAADVALHDLAAREAGVALAALFESSPLRQVTLNALVRGTSPAELAASARAAVRRGHRTLKLKLLGGDLDRDVARVAAVRGAIGYGPHLRLDANEAWEEDRALAAVARLDAFSIEFLEQPIAADDLGALARVRAASPIAIAADEAVRDPASAARILVEGAADVLILKPAALGGLRAARRIAEEAERAGVDALVTSFLDSSLGIAAALQLAASLPRATHAAGLATAPLLAEDLATPLAIVDGSMALPETAGLGLRPDPEALERCTHGRTREVRQ